jgi:ankyrin repeat protein
MSESKRAKILKNLAISYCKRGDLERVKSYVENGVNLDHSYEAMISAVHYNHIDVVRYLDSIDTSSNDIKLDFYHDTLTYAAAYGHLDIVKYFIDQGVTCYTCALDAASKKCHLEVTEYINDVYQSSIELDNVNHERITGILNNIENNEIIDLNLQDSKDNLKMIEIFKNYEIKHLFDLIYYAKKFVKQKAERYFRIIAEHKASEFKSRS